MRSLTCFAGSKIQKNLKNTSLLFEAQKRTGPSKRKTISYYLLIHSWAMSVRRLNEIQVVFLDIQVLTKKSNISQKHTNEVKAHR